MYKIHKQRLGGDKGIYSFWEKEPGLSFEERLLDFFSDLRQRISSTISIYEHGFLTNDEEVLMEAQRILEKVSYDLAGADIPVEIFLTLCKYFDFNFTIGEYHKQYEWAKHISSFKKTDLKIKL